jgi:hypothetical protein
VIYIKLSRTTFILWHILFHLVETVKTFISYGQSLSLDGTLKQLNVHICPRSIFGLSYYLKCWSPKGLFLTMFSTKLCEIWSFHRGVGAVIFTPLWLAAIYRCFGTACRSQLQGSRSPRRVDSWTSWPLKMGPILCTETSVKDYHSTLRYTPEERRSQCTLLRIFFSYCLTLKDGNGSYPKISVRKYQRGVKSRKSEDFWIVKVKCIYFPSILLLAY